MSLVCKEEFQSTYWNIVRFTTMCYLGVLSMLWSFDWVRDYLWGLGWLVAQLTKLSGFECL
jgi:hypothetical protein